MIQRTLEAFLDSSSPVRQNRLAEIIDVEGADETEEGLGVSRGRGEGWKRRRWWRF